MRLYVNFIVLQLVNTALARECNETYQESGEITAVSLTYEERGIEACRYDIRPLSKNSHLILNFTHISNFSARTTHARAKAKPPPRLQNLPLSSRKPGANSAYSKCGDHSPQQVAAGSLHCLPYIEIVSYNVTDCVQSSVICEANMNYRTPQVFHANSRFLNITFKWIPEQDSRFTLDLKLEEKPELCSQGQCRDGSCLSSQTLICDGQVNCLDGSDELNCPLSSQDTHGAQLSSGSESLLEYIVLPSLAFFIIFIIILVCCIKTWRCTLGERRPSRASFERSDFDHLHSASSSVTEDQCSNVVYVPTTRGMNKNLSSNGSKSYHDGRAHCNSEVAASEHQKSTTTTSATEPPMNFPPFIPYSDDGEEGYAHSQKQLSIKQLCHQNYECFRPPNRTIGGSESPPTYRAANPYSLINKESGKGPTRIVKNSNGEVTHYVRCYTMGNNNDYSLSRSAAVENTNAWLSRTVGHVRNCTSSGTRSNRNPSISGDPPPYSEVATSLRATAATDPNPSVFTRGSTGSI